MRAIGAFSLSYIPRYNDNGHGLGHVLGAAKGIGCTCSSMQGVQEPAGKHCPCPFRGGVSV